MLRLFDSERVTSDAADAPGTVTSVSAEGIEVAANGGRLRIKRVQAKGRRKTPAAEWAAEVGLHSGGVLGG